MPGHRNDRYSPELTRDWYPIISRIRKIAAAKGMKAVESLLRGEAAPDPDVQMLVEAERRRNRATYQDLQRKYNAALDTQQQLESRLNHLLAIENHNRRFEIRPKKGTKDRAAAAIALLGDFHCEERVDADGMDGDNEYNPTIARRRAKTAFVNIVKLVNLARQRADIQLILIHLQGDFITGYIHPELEESNYLSPIEATLLAQEILASGLEYIAAETALPVFVHCSYGNHGRTTVKKRISTGYKNSYEWMMYNMLSKQLAGNGRIQFSIPKSEVSYDEVLGFTIRFMHGDQFRYAGGVGGVTIPLLKWIMRSDKRTQADYTFMGHWHQYIPNFQGCCVNGSLIGDSQYGRSRGFPPEPPRQSFMVLEEGRGMTLATPIFV